MASKRVTRSSTRAARATAANPPIAPANIPAPAPAPAPVVVVFAAPQAGGANGASPRRTRSGKILGIMRSVATKLTRPRRAPRKAVPIQDAAREVAETIDVVPTTNPATVPQPPAPPRKRGGKAIKNDNEVQIVANDAAASSSNSEPVPAPIPAPSKRTIERKKSTRSLTSKDKGKARELPIEDDQTPRPTVDPVPVPEPIPTVPIPPRFRKTVEDIERVTQKLRILNATELANDKIQLEDLKWESCVHDNTNLKYQNIPKAAALLYRERRAERRQPARSMPAPPTRTTTPRGGAPVQPQPQPQPPAASTSRGAGPSNGGAGPSPLKREGGVNWGLPEYYKERIRKAKEEGRSLDPLALDHPAPGELPVASTSTSSTAPSASTIVPSASETVPSASATVPVALSAVSSASSTVPPVSSTVPSASSTVPSVSTTAPPASAIVPPASSAVPPVSSTTPLASTTVPTPSTNRLLTANGAAPSRNGNATAVVASDEPRPPRPIQRWNAVIFGYPEGHTPRNPWPASMIDPTGISTHPDAVQDASGAWVLPHRLSASTSVARPATTTAAPQTPATVPVPPAPAPVSRSPPVSTSSNESADLAEVEASISIDVEDGDPHPAADLLPAAAPSASSSNASTVAAAQRPPTVTRQRAASSDERTRELPRQPERDDEGAMVQQIVAEAVREFEEERAARPPQQPASRDRSQSTRAMGPPATPRTAASTSRSPGPIKWSEVKPFGSSFGLAAATKTAELASRGPAIILPENKPGASSGMSIFGLPTNAKGKGKAPANTASIFDRADAKGKGRAAPTTIFGPPAVKGTAQKENDRPATSIFGTPSSNAGKKRAREAEPQSESERRAGPAVPLYGYVSSTGPMKVRVSLVPAVPSPKRQRVSEAVGDTDAVPAGPVAPAAEGARDESAPAPSEDPALQGSTQHTHDGAAKRSRTEFEEGSSRGDADDQDEDEDETRPAKKPRTGSH